MKLKTLPLTIALYLTLVAMGCMRYLTHDRQEVLLERIDIDQTLVVAEHVLERENHWGSVLTLWAIRDQKLTAKQAERVSDLYFEHVDDLTRTFNVWHLTWAISNMYRLGNEEVKHALQEAYEDAKVRAKNANRLADKHVNGDKLYMGDAHSGGRLYAKRHLVVPGNPDYLQSAEEFLEEHREDH